jgi:hypothetical protein
MRNKVCLLTALAAGWVILSVGSASPQSSIGGPKKQGSLGGPASQKSLVLPPPANQAPMPAGGPASQKSHVLPPQANQASKPQPVQEKRPSKLDPTSIKK